MSKSPPGRDGDVWVDVLGPLRVRAGGADLAVSGGRSAVLLATLALSAGQPVSVAVLADHLWPEEPPERVRASLQSQVLRLRRALATDAIRTVPSGYLLDVGPDHVDVLRFRRLVAEAAGIDDGERARKLLGEALRLWRGEPLAGLASTAFERDEVPRLQDERLAALQRRVDLDLADGRHAELVGELREEVNHHPLREPLWHRLIVALSRAGRQAEAVEAYHEVRVHLREELGLDPSADLQQLFRRLLAGEERPASSGLGASRSAPPANAAPAPPRPMQRPAGAGRFTGRRAELAALDRALAARPPGPGTSPILALVGGAGTGKTALAVHWSHRVGDRFPGGHLHVDLRGYDPAAPAEPAAALESLLRALGTAPDRIPTDLDARAALFRTVTAGRGLLVVADNARDSDHVRPLLPGPGNLLAVTSRNQLRGLVARDGAQRVTVGPLAAPDAAALLTALVGADRASAEPRALADLAERCDGLPLALTIAAERAVREPDGALADLVEELRDEEARLDSLRTGEDAASDVGAALSWSYRQLAPDVARSFRLLALQPGAAGSDLAPTAALLGVPPRVARDHLDRLVGVHLVERRRPDRHALRGVVRAYAAARARDEEPDGEREAADARVLDWYLHSAGVAVGLQWYGTRRYHPIELPTLGPRVTPLGFDGPGAAHRWLEGQRGMLITVAAHAAEHGRDAHAGRLVDIVRRFLFHHSHWHDLGRLTDIGLPVARRLGDRVAEADLLRDDAIVRAVLRDFAGSTGRFHESLGISMEIGYDRGVVHALHGLSNVSHFRGDGDAALHYRQQEREVCRRLGDRLSEALALNSSGMDSVWVGQPEIGLDYCRQALAVLEGSSDVWKPRAIAHTLDTVGQAYAALGRHGDAIPAYQAALQAVTGLGDRHGEAVVRFHLGQALHRADDAGAALANWRRALATFSRLSDPLADDVRAEITKLATPA